MNNEWLSASQKIKQVISYRPRLSPEALTLWVVLLFTLFYNVPFWQKVLSGYTLIDLRSWGYALSVFVVLTSLQYIVFVVFAFRLSVKWLLSLLIVIASCVSYFTGNYGTYFDTSMLDNVLQTDMQEARELLTVGFCIHSLVFGALPIAIVWRVRIIKTSLTISVFRHLSYMLVGVMFLGASVFMAYQGLSSLMRNDKELRYLVTPGNYIVSMAQVLASSGPVANMPRLSVGADATMAFHEGEKPMLLVMVIGETVRAENWGLNGYERQTTPTLAQRPALLNFPNMTSCGTSTAVSLPCMFSELGHDNYDKAYAQQHESLLDVLKHAGIDVTWLDNQSGCKGVCDGVASVTLAPADYPALCDGGRCLDEALVEALKDQIEKVPSNTKVVVLHQLGNHGPSYYQRYPPAFEHYTPTCMTSDLAQCSQASITNSYDNSIVYTDSVLSQVIDTLSEQSGYEAAMIYVSDHGESLGEKGLYLHGIPYAIAPDEQTKVPMVWWLSPEMARRQRVDTICLGRIAKKPASHDNLFHSVLGLLDVATEDYQQDLDISRPCREPSKAGS
jgi:lipid A ethanolaminephosphotransferase